MSNFWKKLEFEKESKYGVHQNIMAEEKEVGPSLVDIAVILEAQAKCNKSSWTLKK